MREDTEVACEEVPESEQQDPRDEGSWASAKSPWANFFHSMMGETNKLISPSNYPLTNLCKRL